MKDLLLHPRNEQQLAVYLRQPGHALIIFGLPGSGKRSVGEGLIASLLKISRQQVADYPYYKHIAPKNNSIGIDAVREVEGFIKLKVPAKEAYNRFILVEDGHTLTLEAQNALLKTLEEPPAGTLIIITAQSIQALLPTIRSRAQHVALIPAAENSAIDYFHAKGFNNLAVKKAMAISGGLPGLTHAILAQTDHPMLVATEAARALLQASAYERAKMTDALSKDRPLLENILLILQQMAHLKLLSADGQAAMKWQNILDVSLRALDELSKNGQPKLVVLNLAIHL